MHLMPTYSPQAIAFTHGQGMWLVDSEGRRYLDALSGVAVNSLGHAHPQWVARLTAQLAQLSHVSNHYQIPQQQALATRLCTISGMDNVFFCNSGCEANEAAIKLARLYAHQRGINQPQIIVMENAFHGRTLATLSATGNAKVQKGFEPLVEGFVRVPFANLNALEQVAKQHPNVVALLVEPIQGEGGVRMPEQLDTYLEGLKTICQRHGWLLMLDEVQTGVGRTGKWFAFQHSRILPDVMTLAKGLGGGIPVGACLAAGVASKVLSAGKHGSTFGGNPLAMTAGLVTLQTITDEQLLNNAASMGQYIIDGLRQALAHLPEVKSVRGLGLMIGIEIDRPCYDIVTLARQAGLLVNVTADNVVRLLPALIINTSEANMLVQYLSAAIRYFLEPKSV